MFHAKNVPNGERALRVVRGAVAAILGATLEQVEELFRQGPGG